MTTGQLKSFEESYKRGQLVCKVALCKFKCRITPLKKVSLSVKREKAEDHSCFNEVFKSWEPWLFRSADCFLFSIYTWWWYALFRDCERAPSSLPLLAGLSTLSTTVNIAINCFVAPQKCGKPFTCAPVIDTHNEGGQDGNDKFEDYLGAHKGSSSFGGRVHTCLSRHNNGLLKFKQRLAHQKILL